MVRFPSLSVLYEVRTDFPFITNTAEVEKMIYTKTKLKDGAIVCGPVTAKSTYTLCAVCGKEIQMDLRELILAGAQDPYDTEVNCAECSAKMMHRGDINIDSVIRLTDVLRDIGYGMELHGLCEDFEVEDVRALAPEEYELFVDELLDKISEVRHAG